jgi:hypothetical protein
VGVHVHVAEGPDDTWDRLRGHTEDDWWLIHGVHLPDDHGLHGTVIHNPRSNMNNGVGYARPRRFGRSPTANPVGLGTDGIGADMLDEFRVAFVRGREDDVTLTPDEVWGWLQAGAALFPEVADDVVTWDYAVMDPWRLAYTTGVTPLEITIATPSGGTETVWAEGGPTRVDRDEIQAKAGEAAARLFAKL